MFNKIFNYAPSEDKAAAVEQFVADQPVVKTIAMGVAVSAMTYITGFAISRVMRSAESRFNEYQFDKATVQAAIDAALLDHI